MAEIIVYLILFIVVGSLLISGKKMKKEKEEVGFLEIGVNRKLLFNSDVKVNSYKVEIDPDKLTLEVHRMAGTNYKVPEINYWYFMDQNEEILGATVQIREDDAYQFEMNYNDFLKIKNEILEIEENSNFEDALKQYFEKISKNVKLLSFQFEDLLKKNGIQYEKIRGI